MAAAGPAAPSNDRCEHIGAGSSSNVCTTPWVPRGRQPGDAAAPPPKTQRVERNTPALPQVLEPQNPCTHVPFPHQAIPPAPDAAPSLPLLHSCSRPLNPCLALGCRPALFHLRRPTFRPSRPGSSIPPSKPQSPSPLQRPACLRRCQAALPFFWLTASCRAQHRRGA